MKRESCTSFNMIFFFSLLPFLSPNLTNTVFKDTSLSDAFIRFINLSDTSLFLSDKILFLLFYSLTFASRFLFGEPRRERIIRETGKAPKDFLMLVIKKKEEVKTTETANNDVVLIKDITHKQEKDDRKRWWLSIAYWLFYISKEGLWRCKKDEKSAKVSKNTRVK